jgi:lycopene beta-cyclase
VKEYDYIISGAGAAGLSLLMRMMKESFFNNKKILVADSESKNKNDRTWCFWEKTAGIFEPVIYHQWQHVNFYSNYFNSKLDLDPYWYKMIRSIDFYNFVYNEAAKHDNINFLYGKVEAVGNAGNKGILVIDGQTYAADYVFNSILFTKPVVPPQKFYLLQHLKAS